MGGELVVNNFWNTRIILKVYAGSHSYGTNTKDSDEDFRGVCIPPESYLLGLDRFEQKEQNEPDLVIFSLYKFVHLALQNNPNILDALFVAPNHVLFINEYGEQLRNIRYKFLSKRVYKTYGGYAYSQLKKMVSVSKNAQGKRLESVQKFGYDTKNATHLIRLFKMGIEVLSEGEVNVLRHDNKYLLDIRKGQYPLSYIEQEAKRLQELLDLAYVKTKLSDKPDYDFVNDWLVKTHKSSLGWIR